MSVIEIGFITFCKCMRNASGCLENGILLPNTLEFNNQLKSYINTDRLIKYWNRNTIMI